MPCMQELILIADDGTKFLIDSDALSHIQKYRQHGPLVAEAGGILIGEYRGKDLRITSATKPGRLDQRSRCRFGRRSPHHQLVAQKSWLKSGFTRSHIGDWHTHPQDNPSPSALDYSEWELKLPKRPMLLVILGRKSDWYSLWNGKHFLSVSKYES